MHYNHIFIHSISCFQYRREALPVARGYLNMLQTDQNSQTDYVNVIRLWLQAKTA